MVDELERPVRSFPSYRGQRNYPGWYWACTLGRLIGFESWVERDHLVALNFDAAVIGIVSQPFWLVWAPERGKPRRHAPDFPVRSPDGTVAVLDSRPLHLVAERDGEAFDAVGRACAGVGWGYAVWDRMDTTIVANQRWLAGYRHPRCFDDVVASRLLGLFATPRPLMDGAELAGDPLGTLLYEQGEPGVEVLTRELAGRRVPQLRAALTVLAMHQGSEPAFAEKVKLLAGDSEPVIAGDAIRLLGSLGVTELGERIRGLGDHPSPFVRASVLDYLARAEPELAYPALVQGLRDSDYVVRSRATAS